LVIQTWAKPEVARCHHGLSDHPLRNVAAEKASRGPGAQGPSLPRSRFEDLDTGSHVYLSGNLSLPEAEHPALDSPHPPSTR